nr:MAK10-like protein [Tanacetum cinerariifolium]
MGDENHILTLRDYSKPSHEGYRNHRAPRREQCGTSSIRHHLLCDRNAKESWALLEDLALYDNGSWNDPRDFSKPVKAITLPQDVPSTSNRRLIELENQVQRLMEAHLAPTQPTQNNPRSFNNQSNLKGLIFNFMASQDARLSKFEADFKQQQSVMTNKIDIVLKAITNQITRALTNDTVKNLKLSTYPVLSARSYPTEDPQCSTHIYGSINAITIHPKQQSESHNDNPEENKEEEKDNLKNIHVNPSVPPDPSISFITKKVLKLNSFFESLGLVPQSSNIKLVCTKGDDGDVMLLRQSRRMTIPIRRNPKLENKKWSILTYS